MSSHSCANNAPPSWNVSIPPSCSSGRSIQVTNIYKSYIGPYINSTDTIIPYPEIPKSIQYSKKLLTISEPIPTSWSWRNTGGNKIEKGARNQGSCGGCWAFACATVLGDRYAIKYNIANQALSTSWLISCGAPYGIKSNEECQCGGNTFLAGQWLEKNDIKLESCWPYGVIAGGGYVSPNCLKSLPDDCCSSCCDPDNENAKLKFKVENGSTRSINIMNVNNTEIDANATTMAIQRDIMSGGPVIASFQVSSEFEQYWNYEAENGKVFVPSTIGYNGGHAVVLSGWGIQDGIRYWEVRNSWGLTGDEGYCKFAFSLDTPKSFWSEIDIPKNMGNGLRGGVVSFDAGSLPETLIPFEVGVGGKPVGEVPTLTTGLTFKDFFNIKDADLRLTITAFAVIVLLIIVSYLLNRSKIRPENSFSFMQPYSY